MKSTVLYMPLLNEGTEVYRPVIALDMENNIYKVIGTEQGLSPEELAEEWLFPVNSYVICKLEQKFDGEILVVDKLALS